MKALIIECSTATGSVAAAEGPSLIEELQFENPRGRGAALFTALETIVKRHSDFTRVLVGTGPGSYNALRASIAAAWGIAHARQIPLHGICSLLGYPAMDYDVIGDARANQWFLGRIRSGALVNDVQLMSPDEVRAQIDGSVPIYSTSDLIEEATLLHPTAAALALRSDQTGPAVPIYLKPPHITTPKK